MVQILFFNWTLAASGFFPLSISFFFVEGFRFCIGVKNKRDFVYENRQEIKYLHNVTLIVVAVIIRITVVAIIDMGIC